MSEEGTRRKVKSFTASPWDREEKEKREREAVQESRRARDREIAVLERAGRLGAQQEEWLRILRLEREFQRRADQHASSDSDSREEEDAGDKITVIPHEKLGLKLLDELLDNPSKTVHSPEKTNGRDMQRKSPSEKHFIPLDVTIPDDEFQTQSLPLTNNILKISSDQNPESRGPKSNKVPVPAPRPSKKYENGHFVLDHSDANKSPESSLSKLEISDSSAFFCSNEDALERVNESQKMVWMEQHGNPPLQDGKISSPIDGEVRHQVYHPQAPHNDSRIYENVSCQLQGHGCHTLPKSSGAAFPPRAKFEDPCRTPPRTFEKKFPSMGVSSTLTKKANGYTASDNDILPSLYASSVQVRNGCPKEVPSDLVDKSPEFKKMWLSRPEKLTFQDKIRKFSIQAGDEDAPRDRVKNSRAQRELEMKFSDGQRRASLKVSEN